jgi:hypothetical protein
MKPQFFIIFTVLAYIEELSYQSKVSDFATFVSDLLPLLKHEVKHLMGACWTFVRPQMKLCTFTKDFSELCAIMQNWDQ